MNKIQRLFGDSLIMAKRCSLLSKRNPDTFLTSIVSPVLMMLLFTCVIGGAVNVGNISYINYIVPGILLQSLGQCAATTAISVSCDMKNGIIDRFRSMPIRRQSILTGHVLEACLRNMMTVVIVIVLAFFVGFRPEGRLSGWMVALALLVLYMIALSWISVCFGILANGPEGAGAFSVFAIALPYLSSGFVPIDTMPEALRIFAEYQPMTPVIDTLRNAMTGEALNGSALIAAIFWCLALMVVFYLLSLKAFQNKALK